MDPAAVIIGSTAVTMTVVALVVGSVGVLILASDPRRTRNLSLGVFLLLVAGNFVSQAIVPALQLGDLLAGVPPDERIDVRLITDSVGFLFLVPDPFALAYFASVFPRRSALAENRLATLAVGALVGVLLAVELTTHALSVPTVGLNPWRIVLFVYLGAAYAFAGKRILESFLDETSGVMAKQVRAIALGLLVVTIPRLGLVLRDLNPSWRALLEPAFERAPWLQPALLLTVMLGTVLLLLAEASRTIRVRRGIDEARRRDALKLLRLARALVLAIAGVWVLGDSLYIADVAGFAGPPRNLAWTVHRVVNDLTYSSRWFVFAGATVHGILRYEVLGVRAPGSEPLVAALAGGATLSGTLVAYAVSGPRAALVTATFASAGGAVAAAAFARRRSRARVAELLDSRRLESYQAALAATHAAGDPSSAAVEKLRRDLGVTEREHAMLLAVVRAEEEIREAHVQLPPEYEVVRRLGTGGSAIVYLAREVRTDSLVVLKRLRNEGTMGLAWESALRELEVARRASHENLLSVHDVVRLADGAIVVLEYAEGGSLADSMDASGHVSPKRAASILRGVLSGLEALHEAGIVHGDVKAANVLLVRDASVKLADFGIARLAPHRRIADGAEEARMTIPGTPDFMAPELFEGKAATTRADLYSVGRLGILMLTGDADPLAPSRRGRAPTRRFPGAFRGTAGIDSSSAEELIVRAWSDFLRRATARDPTERYPSASAMRAAVPALGDTPLSERSRRLLALAVETRSGAS